jgi:hypothetical protein
VGARSLVTRDVPPYAVVAGSPARVIRHRFPEAIVERLLRVEWWRHGPDVLQALDPRRIEAFLDRAEQCEAPVMTLQPLTFEDIAAAT